MMYQKLASTQNQQLGANAGRTQLAAAGRAAPQGPSNFRGNDAGGGISSGGRGNLLGKGPVTGAAPQQQYTGPAQTGDVRFNRYAPPPGQRPMGQIQRDYGTPEFRPRGGLAGGRQRFDTSNARVNAPQATAALPGRMQGGQQPFPMKQGYQGMMIQPGASLMQAMQGGGQQPQELGGGAPMQAYQPGPAADQSAMTAKSSFMGDVDARNIPFVEQMQDIGSLIYGAPGMEQGRNADDNYENQVESTENAYGGAAAERANSWTGVRMLAASNLGDLGLAGATEGGNPFSNDIVAALGNMLSGMSNAMTKEDMDRINEFFGESGGAYRGMMDAARGIMNPDARNAWEDAARGDLQATVNADKMANLRMAQAAAGRGGFAGSNAMTGVYGNAANALATGERGIAQDRFGRDLAATQAGIAGLGAGGSALERLLDSGFTSNKELLSLLLTGAEKGKDIAGVLADILGGKFMDV